MVKNQPAKAVHAGDTGSIPGSGRSPGGESGNHSSILAGQFPGQRSLAESDTTERWSTHTHRSGNRIRQVLTKCKALNSTGKFCDLVKVHWAIPGEARKSAQFPFGVHLLGLPAATQCLRDPEILSRPVCGGCVDSATRASFLNVESWLSSLGPLHDPAKGGTLPRHNWECVTHQPTRQEFRVKVHYLVIQRNGMFLPRVNYLVFF